MSEENRPVNDLTTSEIVEEFNRLAPTVGLAPVKKFENRRVATRRLLDVRKKAATAETLTGYRASLGSGEVAGGRADAAKRARPTRRGRGRPPAFADDDRVLLATDRNPKRPGTKAHERFEAYRRNCGSAGATVAALLADGLTRGDLRYDAKKGYVEVLPRSREG